MPTNSPLQVPVINGVVWGFAEIKPIIAGIPFTGGFKTLNYSRKRTREKPMSNSPDPIGKTRGENAYEASAEMYLEWWRATIKTIVATLGPGYGDRSFPIFVSYGNFGFAPFQDVIYNCTFDSTEANNQTGPAALTRTVEFNPTKIKFCNEDDLTFPLAGVAQ